MRCDEEYVRLQAAFFAMTKQSDLSPDEQIRWFALVQACELLISDMRSKSKSDMRSKSKNLSTDWHRAA
jgi:hypothetical protein